MTNVLFYFHSTIAQCMAALLALTGMFAVYRIQVQENKLSRTMDSAKEFAEKDNQIHDPVAKRWLDYSVKENLIRIKKNLVEHRDPKLIAATIDGINDYVCRIEAYSGTLIKMQQNIRRPIYCCAVLLIISVAGIAASEFFTKLKSEIVYLYLVAVSSFVTVSVILIILYIKESFQNDEPSYTNLYPG